MQKCLEDSRSDHWGFPILILLPASNIVLFNLIISSLSLEVYFFARLPLANASIILKSFCFIFPRLFILSPPLLHYF
jgi:hypothetical protein